MRSKGRHECAKCKKVRDKIKSLWYKKQPNAVIIDKPMEPKDG